MTSPSKRRDVDVMKLMMSDHHVLVKEENINEFHVEFKGPIDSDYEGGIWKVHVELPDAYPFKSPSIGFINRIFHPNVDEMAGSVCLDVINQTWSPMFDFSFIAALIALCRSNAIRYVIVSNNFTRAPSTESKNWDRPVAQCCLDLSVLIQKAGPSSTGSPVRSDLRLSDEIRTSGEDTPSGAQHEEISKALSGLLSELASDLTAMGEKRQKISSRLFLIQYFIEMLISGRVDTHQECGGTDGLAEMLKAEVSHLRSELGLANDRIRLLEFAHGEWRFLLVMMNVHGFSNVTGSTKRLAGAAKTLDAPPGRAPAMA
eukprot:gene18614-25129_t